MKGQALSARTCSKCKLVQPLSEFRCYIGITGKTLHRYKCKTCVSKETSVQKRKKYREDIRHVMITSAKNRAKWSMLPCTIQSDDIFVPEYCPILHIKLKINNGITGDDSPSLDRINTKLGYVPGNIAVISYRANRIKNDATIEEFEAVLAFMKQHEDQDTRLQRLYKESLNG